MIEQARSVTVTALTIIASSICFGACDQVERGMAWQGAVDTLTGGAVVVESPAEGLWAPDEAWRLVEDVRIGRLDGDGPDLFGGVDDLTVDPFGRVWISEGEAMELRVFEPDGTWVRTVGRPGQGPGEFAEGPALRWGPEGLLWALDQQLGRFSRFDTAGNYVDAVPRHSTSLYYSWPGMILGDGTVVDVGSRFDRQSFTTVLVHRDATGAVLDTLDLPEQPQGWVVASEGGTTLFNIPHGPRMVWRLDSRGSLWFGVSDSLRIMRRNLLQGDTTIIVRRWFEPVPVTEAEKDAAMAVVENVRSRGGDATRSDLPDTKPAFTSFEVDSDGRLWVIPVLAADTLVGRTFDVFDPGGRYLGRVISETNLRAPFAFGDGVLWATTRDELNLPYVVRMRSEGR